MPRPTKNKVRVAEYLEIARRRQDELRNTSVPSLPCDLPSTSPSPPPPPLPVQPTLLSQPFISPLSFYPQPSSSREYLPPQPSPSEVSSPTQPGTSSQPSSSAATSASSDAIPRSLSRSQLTSDYIPKAAKDVHELLEKLREEMRDSDSSLLENAYFAYSGSSYEWTEVSTKTDFDISVVLSTPFEAENFILTEAHEPGFYKLKPLERDDYQDRISSRGFLKVQELKEDIIDELIDILKKIERKYANWKLIWSNNVNSIQVLMRGDEDAPIKIDLVPVLRGRDMADIPGRRHKRNLPYPLSQRKSLEYHLTLGAAPFLKVESDYHLLTTIAFAEMEKICMKSSKSVQNAVRLVKLTSIRRGWKKDFGLRGFHIKRIAIKNFDELHGLNTWDAYKSLLMHLSTGLDDGVIDGFFLKDLNIYCKDEDNGEKLASKIEEAANTIQPHHLMNFFTR